MKHPVLAVFLLLTIYISNAQTQVIVRDRASNAAVKGATIRSGSLVRLTDSTGAATISGDKIFISAVGYTSMDTTVSGNASVLILLSADVKALEDVTVISSTRNYASIENSPLKVELLSKEEMSEEVGIKPGNIASILGDVSGVQIQQSSASSGNANVRIQGLEGRYTQILRDGMPLFEGYAGGFGVMTIAPLDLKQIELIKGSASTLFGGGAIGGLVNLISKRPVQKQELDALVNYTTLKEFNTNVYASNRNQHAGYTFFTGYTNQQAVDVNKDGLSDVARTKTFVVHPRLYIHPSSKSTLTLGYEGTFDDRIGGDMLVLDNKKDGIHQYFERNKSARNTGEYIFEQNFSGKTKLTFKGSVSNFSRDQFRNTDTLKGKQLNYFNEISVYTPFRTSNLVAGLNVSGDHYRTKYPSNIPLQKLNNHYIGLFAQYSWNITPQTILESGLRTDHHNKYGFFTLPRIALFHRFSEHWAARTGFAMGYKAPDPLAQQIVEYEVKDINPVSGSVRAERSYGANFEVNYKIAWGEENSLFINHAFFLTQINHPILFQQDISGKINLMNASKPVQTSGFDTYAQLQLNGVEVYAGYTYTNAVRKYLTAQQFIPLTPKNRFAFTVVKEIEEQWRFGLEGSYTGPQRRFNYTETQGYFFIAAMIQRNLGEHFNVVLNGENLLDFRQTKKEAIFSGTITSPVFQPLWAPIDGRVINLSLRYHL